MRKYNDHLEEQLGNALESAGIEFVHESESGNSNNGIDFYLPNQNVYIEVKQYHTTRIGAQMGRKDEVIAIQGKEALKFFIALISK